MKFHFRVFIFEEMKILGNFMGYDFLFLEMLLFF